MCLRLRADGLRSGLLFQCTADVEEIVGDDAEPDPTLHSGLALVAAAAVRFVPVSCPASDHFWMPASASAACLPIGTALVTEFAPRRNSCRFMARARENRTRPRRRCPEQTKPLAPRYACPPTSPISFSRIRLRGANDGEGRRRRLPTEPALRDWLSFIII